MFSFCLRVSAAACFFVEVGQFAVASPKPINGATPLTQSVAEVIAKLDRTKKNKSALNIQKAIKSLQKGALSSAAQTLSGVKSDPLFEDYYPGLLSEAHLKRAMDRVKRKDCQGAESDVQAAQTLLIELDVKYPLSRFRKRQSDRFATAEIVQAECLASRAKWDSAQKKYEQAFSRLSTDRMLAVLPRSVVENYARSCVKKDRGYCLPWLRKLAETYPKQSVEGVRLTAAASSGFDLSKVTRSYERLTAPYKASDADQAAIDEAIQSMLSGKKSDAKDQLQKFLEMFPRSGSRSRARFWLAHLQSRSGQGLSAESKALYEQIVQESPTGYYGLLASFALSKEIENLIDSTVPASVTVERALEAKELFRVQRAEKLLSAGATEAAAEELREVPIRSNIASEYLIYLAGLANSAHADLSSFQIVNELIQRKFPGVYSGFGIQLVFPVRFEKEIEKVSSENGLDPILVMSLIKQESAFNPEVVSSAGAFGLMQVMPFTAVAVDSSVEQRQMMEVDQNLRVGSKYISEQIRKFNGNIAFALAAYNAGPTRMNQWAKELKPDWGLLEFVESIPYRETRDYVSSIMRHYAWYSYLTQGKKMVSFDFFWANQTPSVPSDEIKPEPQPEPEPKVEQ